MGLLSKAMKIKGESPEKVIKTPTPAPPIEPKRASVVPAAVKSTAVARSPPVAKPKKVEPTYVTRSLPKAPPPIELVKRVKKKGSAKKAMPQKADFTISARDMVAESRIRDILWDKNIDELKNYADIMDVPYQKSKAKSYIIGDLIEAHSTSEIEDVISGKVGYEKPKNIGPVTKGYMIGAFLEDETNIYDVRGATILDSGDVELEIWVYPHGEGYPKAILNTKFTYPQFKLLEAGREVNAFSRFDPMTATDEEVDEELLVMLRAETAKRGGVVRVTPPPEKPAEKPPEKAPESAPVKKPKKKLTVKDLADKLLSGEMEPSDIKDEKLLDKVIKHIGEMEEVDVEDAVVGELEAEDVLPPEIDFTYEDLLQKAGPFKGYPAYVTFKKKMTEMGIRLEKDDPLWVALKDTKKVPVDLIAERLGVGVATVEAVSEAVEEPEEIEEEVPSKVLPPARADVEEEEYIAMMGVLKNLKYDEVEIMAEDPRKVEWPAWKRRALDDTIEGYAEGFAKQIINKEISEEDVPEQLKDAVAEYVSDYIADLKEDMAVGETPIPEVVSSEIKDAYGYEDILDESDRPNFFKFVSVLKKMEFDTSDADRNQRWFTTSKITKRMPDKGKEVFKETWPEFQKRTATAYKEFMPDDDKDRREFVSRLWKKFGRFGKPIPVETFGSQPVMSHAEWMSLYLSRPYKLGFKKVNELWHTYGKYGEMPPDKALPVDRKVAEWTTKDTTPADVTAVLEWVEENRQPVRYEHLFDVFGSREKAVQVMKDMEEMTWEGQEKRFRDYFENLALYGEGREKLKFIALSSGYNFQNQAVLNYLLSEHFGEEGPTGYDPEQHMDTGIVKDAFYKVVGELQKTKEEADAFNTLWRGSSITRSFEMKDDMDEIPISSKEIAAVGDDQIKVYGDYVKSVGGRDVEDYEFFAAHPELSRKEAKTIYEKYAQTKSALEYGEYGRKPLGEKELKSVLDRIVDGISTYRMGENKNKLARKVHDLKLFNREWNRRFGKPYVDLVEIDVIGNLSPSDAERYANDEFTEEMLPDVHVQAVHDYIKKNLRIPGREDLLSIVPDPAEADYILKNVIYTDVENILGGTRPYAFSDDEIEAMARRKGLSSHAIRAAMKAWHDRRQLPMTAMEEAQRDFETRQLELGEKYGQVASSEDTREHLREIMKLAPDRSAAVRQIGQYIDDLKVLVKAKKADKTRMITGWKETVDGKSVTHVGLAELELKKRKSKKVQGEIAEINNQIEEINKEMLQLDADIDRAYSDMKYRVYKNIPEDYLRSQARFGAAGNENQQYANFSRRQVEVARSPGTFKQGSDKVYVNLEDIYNNWIAPIETDLNDIIRKKAKISKDPVFKEAYDAYIIDEKKEEELEQELDKVRENLGKEGISEDKLNYLSGELERISSVMNRIDREQKNRLERLADYAEREKVEPTIQELITERETKGKWSEDWQKKVATIAFMNKARELGIYDYMYQMSLIGHDMSPPMKDIPLTIYPSDSSSIREALFGEWLQEALTSEDISKWDPRTMIQFVGEDWDSCDDIFSRIDTAGWENQKKREEKASARKDKWQDCAVRKAKVIQSQAIAQADPLVLQPIVESIVKQIPIEKVSTLEKEKAHWKKQMAKAVELSEKMNEKVAELESDMFECEAEIVELREELSSSGVVTAEVKKGRKKKIEPVTAVTTEKEKALLKKIAAKEAQLANLQGDVEDVVETACDGDAGCVESSMGKIAGVERSAVKAAKKRPARRVSVSPAEPRDFCFLPPEWDTFVLAISERKQSNTEQLKSATKMLDGALSQNISRTIPVYQSMVDVLSKEKTSLANLEDFIRKYDEASFICSQDEMKNVRMLTDDAIEEALEI